MLSIVRVSVFAQGRHRDREGNEPLTAVVAPIFFSGGTVFVLIKNSNRHCSQLAMELAVLSEQRQTLSVEHVYNEVSEPSDWNQD